METVIKTYDELSKDEFYDILELRIEVFVVEQTCPYQDLDGLDKSAIHIYLKDEGKIAAYLRIIKLSNSEYKIGRVIARKRRCGIGSVLLKEAIKYCKDTLNAEMITVNAQTYAKDFYGKQGFIQVSEEFLEDDIPHIKMDLKV